MARYIWICASCNGFGYFPTTSTTSRCKCQQCGGLGYVRM